MLQRHQYEHLSYTLPTQYRAVRMSTLVLAPPGLDTARLTGFLVFDDNVVLCVYEVLDFQQGIITAYRYEVSRCQPPFSEVPLPDAEVYCRAHYPNKRKLYWYDSWPHPNSATLASTHDDQYPKSFRKLSRFGHNHYSGYNYHHRDKEKHNIRQDDL